MIKNLSTTYWYWQHCSCSW